MADKFSNEERQVVCELADRGRQWYPCIRSDRAKTPSMYHVQAPFTSVPMCPTLENTDQVTEYLEEVAKWREKFLKLPRVDALKMLGLDADSSSEEDDTEDEEADADKEKETDGDKEKHGDGEKDGEEHAAADVEVKREASRITEEELRSTLVGLLQKADLPVCCPPLITTDLLLHVLSLKLQQLIPAIHPCRYHRLRQASTVGHLNATVALIRASVPAHKVLFSQM